MIYVQLLVICFAVIIIWLILSNFSDSQIDKEAMRTIPRPNPNYDPNEYVTITNNPKQIQKKNINVEIDNMIKLYFGRNNIPTKLCIATYYQYFVNQGNVSIPNKLRLKDFCYYILQFVIPSIPSELNPNPTTEWPYIEFLSNSLKSYTIQSAKTYTPLVMYEVASYQYNDPNSNLKKGFNFNLDGLDQPGISASFDIGSSNSDGTDKNKQDDKGSGSNCGCPTACFSNLLKNLQSENNSPGSSNSSGMSLDASSNGTKRDALSINSPGGYTANNFLSDPSLFSKTNNIPSSDLKITNEPQTKNPGTLDNSINNFINNYFGVDPTTGIGKPIDDMPIPSQFLPTNFGKVEFTDFFTTRTLIDQEHKTKLYDMVHYFMENIIIGLPTDTVPFSYVEWRPIVWSSVSYV